MRVDIEFIGRKFRKVFDYVGKFGVFYVVLVGKKDFEVGKVIFRDMKLGE